MIFFLVMPGLFGGFGNSFMPIFLGAPEVVYPRVNNLLFVSLPRLPASHKRCKVAWFGDAGGSETIETIPNIILIRITRDITLNPKELTKDIFTVQTFNNM